MKFEACAEYLKKLEDTSSRLSIIKTLAELLEKSDSIETKPLVYLSLGILAPNYEGVLLNVAEKMMLRVVARAYQEDEDKVKSEYKKTGDIGDVAEVFSRNTHSAKSKLTITEVYDRLLSIAKDSGDGSQDRKIEKTADLLKNLDPLSARFVSRIPVGKLRLGFSEKTVIEALSAISGYKAKQIESEYNIRPDIGYIAALVKRKQLGSVTPEVGIPVVPMLAQRLNSTSEMVKKMGEVSVEPKFDGLRIFIHYKKKGNVIKIFTRNMNAIETETLPELKDVGEHIDASEIILDSEAIGIDEKREIFLDFQKTIQRRRKHGIDKAATDIPLQFQVFDILMIDGKSLIKLPYTERREVLVKTVKSGKLLRVDENVITSDPQIIRDLHKKYLKMGLEGIIAKRTGSHYVSGRTGWNWVKMKEEEGRQGKLSDTLDCVIMGYTQGKGKRAGFGVGQFLAGVSDGDSFKTITKVGTGLTDEQFLTLSKELKNLRSKEKPKEYKVNKDLSPDFWVSPKVVVELAADEITVSPKHTAGYALRFPRLIRFRKDKGPNEATTVSEVKSIMKAK